MDDHQRITELFSEADASVAMQMIVEWDRARTSSRSNSAMNSYVFNTKSFKMHIDLVFGAVYDACMGPCDTTASVRPKTYATMRQGYITEVVIPSFVIRSEDAFVYVKNSGDFRSSVIERLRIAHDFYRRDVFDTECERAYWASFVDHFRYENLHEIDKAVQEVVRSRGRAHGVRTKAKGAEGGSHGPSGGSHGPSGDDLCDDTAIHFVDRYRARSGEEPTIHILRDVQDFLRDRNRLVDAYLEHLGGNYDLEFDHLTRRFRDTFGREITAYELRALQSRVAQEGADVAVRDYYALFTKRHAHFASAFRNFFDREPGVYDFAREVLRHVDEEDDAFMESIVRIFVTYPEYERCTTEFVVGYVLTTWEVTLAPRHIEFFYSRLAEERLSKTDERVPQRIELLYEEYLHQTSEIREVFVRILCREPDTVESDFYVEYYRNKFATKVVRIIEDELYDSMEYQDVVKELIVALRPSIARREVFKHMTDMAREGISQFRTKEDVERFISSSN